MQRLLLHSKNSGARQLLWSIGFADGIPDKNWGTVEEAATLSLCGFTCLYLLHFESKHVISPLPALNSLNGLALPHARSPGSPSQHVVTVHARDDGHFFQDATTYVAPPPHLFSPMLATKQSVVVEQCFLALVGRNNV